MMKAAVTGPAEPYDRAVSPDTVGVVPCEFRRAAAIWRPEPFACGLQEETHPFFLIFYMYIEGFSAAEH